MESLKRFNGLNGSTVSREEIGEIIQLAQKENQADVIYRLFKLLNDNPFDSSFEITELENYPAEPVGLNGVQHKGDYRLALDNCGRLNPGYKFDQGRVVKVSDVQPKANGQEKAKETLKKTKVKKANTVKPKAEPKANGQEKTKTRPNYGRKRKFERKPKVGRNGQTALFGTEKAKTDTKVSKSDTKDALNGSFIEDVEKIPEPQPKATVVAKVENLPPKKYKTAVDRLAENQAPKQLYNIKGDLAKFLGKIEIKPVQSLVVTLDSGEGGGKTHTLYNWANEFFEGGYKTIIWSLEEHATSSLATDKAEQYFGKNKAYIPIESETDGESKEETLKRLFESINDFDVIMIDSWAKVMELDKTINIDQDLRKKFNGKLIVVVLQRTVSGEIRGGSKAGFDGDVILKVEVDRDDFRNNYIYNHKNRYNDYMPISDLKYSPYHKALRKTDVQKSAESPKLSFTAVEL